MWMYCGRAVCNGFKPELFRYSILKNHLGSISRYPLVVLALAPKPPPAPNEGVGAWLWATASIGAAGSQFYNNPYTLAALFRKLVGQAS
ncbi:MAG: hypothetical protein EAY72_12475 [Bacteroidetes bacterium]|nr:MAG: hypothetical protein EAY72_12475 [Bacteroidota bacterium]